MATLADNLVWYWDLATAGATEDDQHNGLTLTKGGTVTVSTGGAPDGGDCISVGSGAGYYANASVARTIDTEAGFSVNIWGYSTADSGLGNWLINHRDSANSDAHWQITARRSDGTDKAAVFDNAGASRSALSSEATASAWHMFTLVDDATSCRLYIDGTLAATDATSLGNRDSAARPFAIGTGAWDTGAASLRHNGRLFGAGVWGVAFGTDAITALYNSGSSWRYAALAGVSYGSVSPLLFDERMHSGGFSEMYGGLH